MSDGTICDTCYSRPHASDCPMREDALRERVAVLESRLNSVHAQLERWQAGDVDPDECLQEIEDALNPAQGATDENTCTCNRRVPVETPDGLFCNNCFDRIPAGEGHAPFCMKPVPTMPDGDPEPCSRPLGHEGDCETGPPEPYDSPATRLAL